MDSLFNETSDDFVINGCDSLSQYDRLTDKVLLVLLYTETVNSNPTDQGIRIVYKLVLLV